MGSRKKIWRADNGGEVILGDIGYGENIAFTALGDAVNVAARLQDISKELACEVVISEGVYQTAGLTGDELPRQEITVRGRTAAIVVRTTVKAEISQHLLSDLQKA